MTDSKQAQSLLYLFANNLSPLTKELWSKIDKLFVRREIKKMQYFQQSSEPAQNFAFVIKGFFCVGEENENTIKSFVFENQLLASYTSLLDSNRKRYDVWALEDSIIYQANYQEIQKVLYTKADLTRLNTIILENEYIKSENRIQGLLLNSAQEKLKHMQMLYQKDFDRIPKKYIANYLRINQATLSRLLSKK